MNSLVETLLYFVFISAVVAVVCTLARGGDWKWLAREALHFLTLMVVGIIAFSGLVYVLEWIFIRKL
ncbi:MAG: hypothetical protein HY717_03580 [Planctomycetes bacterium]|nr:hypothetical protein [Planctomycetota bacterium]